MTFFFRPIRYDFFLSYAMVKGPGFGGGGLFKSRTAKLTINRDLLTKKKILFKSPYFSAPDSQGCRHIFKNLFSIILKTYCFF
jgi:hypothetical protein